MSLHKAFTGLDSRKQGKYSSKVADLRLELSFKILLFSLSGWDIV